MSLQGDRITLLNYVADNSQTRRISPPFLFSPPKQIVQHAPTPSINATVVQPNYSHPAASKAPPPAYSSTVWGTQSVCVFCVFFPSILDIKFVGRTSRGHTGGRSHRIFNPPSFCGACLDFCREKDSAIPFPRRPWSRILCTNELIVLHPLGIFILVF